MYHKKSNDSTYTYRTGENSIKISYKLWQLLVLISLTMISDYFSQRRWTACARGSGGAGVEEECHLGWRRGQGLEVMNLD